MRPSAGRLWDRKGGKEKNQEQFHGWPRVPTVPNWRESGSATVAPDRAYDRVDRRCTWVTTILQRIGRPDRLWRTPFFPLAGRALRATFFFRATKALRRWSARSTAPQRTQATKKGRRRGGDRPRRKGTGGRLDFGGKKKSTQTTHKKVKKDQEGVESRVSLQQKETPLRDWSLLFFRKLFFSWQDAQPLF